MSRGSGSIRPRPLAPGSVVGVCAPSGPVDGAALEAGIAWLESQGYRVRQAKHLLGRRGYLAGTDEERLGDLLELIRAPEVRGIVLARGGYGIARILAGLDPRELRESRKLLVGYSDATSLLLFLRSRAGLASIHGPMLERRDLTVEAAARWLAVVRGEVEAQEPLDGVGLRGGRVRGPLVGGSLTLVAHSLGTPWEVDTRGAILFLEEVREEPYILDRLLTQLREAGKLRDAAGVAVGQLVRCESARYPEPTARAVLEDVLVPHLEGPIVDGLPFGHIADNRALGVGIEAELDGDRGTLRMLEAVVEEGD